MNGRTVFWFGFHLFRAVGWLVGRSGIETIHGLQRAGGRVLDFVYHCFFVFFSHLSHASLHLAFGFLLQSYLSLLVIR